MVAIDCATASLYSAAFLDGHLDDEVRKRALACHLDKCAACRNILVAMSGLDWGILEAVLT